MWRGLFVFYFCEEVSQMVQIDFVDLVVAFIAAMGVPSAVMGLIVWRLKTRMEAREASQDKKNADQQPTLSSHRPEHQSQHCPR